MSRANKRDTEIRAMLETIGIEAAMVSRMLPVTRVRVEQGSVSLPGLLVPAKDEIDGYAKSMSVIRDQVTAALAKLKEC